MLIYIVALITIVAFYTFYWKRRNLPPGPTPFPIIGNVLQIDTSDRNVEQFKKWKEQYGPIITVWTAETPAIIIMDYDLMVKYIVKQSHIFSNRPEREDSVLKPRGGVYGIIITSGEKWRDLRRFALHTLRDFGLGKNQMEERILTETDALLKSVNANLSEKTSEDEEIDLCSFTDLAVGSVINTVICGYRFTIDDREKEFHQIKEHTERFIGMITKGTARLLMRFPALNKVWKYNNPVKQGSIAMQHIFDFLQKQIDGHLKEMDYSQEFEARDFIDAFLMEKAKRDLDVTDHSFDFMQLKNTCFDMWLAGQETTSSALQWIFAHMIQYQHVQEKVQKELDQVIGSTRLITCSDKTALHYTNAVIMECFRCANLLIFNLPHATAEEVEVEGYKLPKNTVIFPQLGMLMRDEKAFPNPNSFNPDRFLDEEGHFKNIEEMLPFSLGKRQCLGEGLARMELFLFTANVLNRFRLYSGAVPPAMQKISPGALGHKHYTCIVKSRL